jgi:hypothetical protein
VVQYANAAFPSNNFAENLRPWNTTYSSMSPAELYNIYSRASENANLLLAETSSTYGRYVATYRYGMNYTKWQEVSSSEQIINGNANWAFPLYSQGDNNYLIPKLNEYFVRESVNAEIGFPYVMLPLFTAEEVLFNRIEANAYLNNTAACLTDLNTYVSKRVDGYNPAAHTVTANSMSRYFGTSNLRNNIVNTVLAFKRIEFVQEGMRWFDIQRYNIPVTHTTRSGSVISVPAGDLRRILQIPQTATISGIAQNPR